MDREREVGKADLKLSDRVRLLYTVYCMPYINIGRQTLRCQIIIIDGLWALVFPMKALEREMEREGVKERNHE